MNELRCIKEEKLYYKLIPYIDQKYKEFCLRIYKIESAKLLGVRIPILKDLAKKWYKEIPTKVSEFMWNPYHYLFEENILHGLFIKEINDYKKQIKYLVEYAKKLDNWAIVDIFEFKLKDKNKKDFLSHIKDWLRDNNSYTNRFAIVMLKKYYLKDDSKLSYLDLIMNTANNNDYYVEMVQAWYLSIAYKSFKSKVLKILNNWNYSINVLNKTIQKIKELSKTTKEEKEQLDKLKK